MEGYWCYWHGGKGYSGVGLHVSKALAPERPTFSHPEFDFENRIAAVDVGDLTVASVYVPNGGKDFPAKMRFLEAMDDYAASFQAGGRRLVLCGDMNVARTDKDVHPKERKPRAIGQLPEERALIERILGRGLVDLGRALDPGQRRALHLVAARGATCGSATSAGGSTTSSPARRSPTRATACPVQNDVGTSDHAPVMATFA